MFCERIVNMPRCNDDTKWCSCLLGFCCLRLRVVTGGCRVIVYIFECNYCAVAVALVPAVTEVQLGLGITDTVFLPAQHGTRLLGEQTLCAQVSGPQCRNCLPPSFFLFLKSDFFSLSYLLTFISIDLSTSELRKIEIIFFDIFYYNKTCTQNALCRNNMVMLYLGFVSLPWLSAPSAIMLDKERV